MTKVSLDSNTRSNEIDFLSSLNEALHWIQVSKLQIERYVENLLLTAESDDKNATKVVADAHFLLNSLAQSGKALKRVDSELQNKRAFQLKYLRNIYEHWEQHKKSFTSSNYTKTRSGKDFSNAYPNTVPWVFKIDDTGTWISNLRLEDVWEELLEKEATIKQKIGETTYLADVKPNTISDKHAKFPRRDSKILGFSIVTQNIILDFK